jgi:peptidyl-prolyl cis-trans isomerase C
MQSGTEAPPGRSISNGGSPAEAVPGAADTSPVSQPARRRWLREPLLHFLLLGTLLFLGHRVLNPGPEAGTQSTRIELTDDDLRQMTVAWLAQGRPAPTPEQMQSLVEARIREEILYREALALGLDRNDTIVKRQLARKMEFLAEDVSVIGEPKPEELSVWFAKNAQRFALSPRASFRHLYFSGDRRGQRAREEAARAVHTLVGKPGEWPGAAKLADRFMFQDFYPDRSFEQLAKDFGPGFAQALFQLTPGSWQGPIESGYGWHVIWVDSITPGRVPTIEEVESDAKMQWVAEQRAEAKRKAFDAIRARYQIVFSGSAARAAAHAGGIPGKTAP